MKPTMLFFQKIHEDFIDEKRYNHRRYYSEFNLTDQQISSLELVVRDLEKKPELSDVSAQQRLLEYYNKTHRAKNEEKKSVSKSD